MFNSRSQQVPRRTLLHGFFAAMLAVFATLSLSQSAWAQTLLGPQELQLLRKIEAYLNGITTLESRFVQVTSEGAYAEGKLALERPDLVRFEYTSPDPLLLISDGADFIYYDQELEQATYLSLEDTPLWFIMRPTVRFDERVRVMDLEQRSGTIFLTLEDARFPDLGQLTLIFREAPLELRRWEVRDPQGIVTEVALVQPRFGTPIAEKVFDFRQLPGLSIEERLRPQNR